jgi:hypothetical protein
VFLLLPSVAPNQINKELQFVFFAFAEQPKTAQNKSSMFSTHYATTTENRNFM